MMKLLDNFSEEDGVHRWPPLSQNMEKELDAVFTVYTSSKFKNEYLKLLRYSDGLQIENVVINSSENIIHSNNHYKSAIEIGTNGNMDTLIFDMTTETYQVVNFFDHTEIVEKFNTLDKLLAYILNYQGITKPFK